MLPLVAMGICFFLAYSNGANDNFKGVATLYGSGTCGYRRALAWATVTTLAGFVFNSLCKQIITDGLLDSRRKALISCAQFSKRNHNGS